MNINRMRISTRLRLGFSLMVVMLISVTVLGIIGMAKSQRRMDEITSVNNVKAKLAMAMRDTVYDRMISLRNMALIGSLSETQPEAERIQQQLAKYIAARDKLGKMFSEAADTAQQERGLFQHIKELDASALPLISRSSEMAMAAQSDQIYSLLVNEFLPVQTKWLAALGDLIAVEDAQSEHATIEARAAFESARLLMLLIGVAAVMVAMLVSFQISRSLLHQLGGEPSYAMAIADKIAAGDLCVEVQTTPDDVSSLMAAMKKMRNNLAEIVRNVRQNTETIALASSKIVSGNLDLSARTEQQASSLQQTASLMKELTSTVRQNAENANIATKMVDSASSSASKGGAVVSHAVQTMRSIDDSAKKIVEIISVIDGLAFQTNILALNAAVEAARAGEQGRGFAVVASEVRALAQRSAGAAREIKELINDSVEKVLLGTELVDVAGATMAEIVENVKYVNHIMAEIAAASQAQSSGIDHVGSTISQMDHVTQQNAALVEQAAAAAASMEERAGMLAQAVSVFKLEAAIAVATQVQTFRSPCLVLDLYGY